MEDTISISHDVIDGKIVSVIKPVGMSSFGVVRRIKSASGISRIGHAGTLDPFAEGVLVVGIGRQATRTLGTICELDKEYIADVKLGVATDTGDPTGKVVSESPVPGLQTSDFVAVLNGFRGQIEQVPPIYSALKINGKRFYSLARKGIKIERKSRPVTIYDLELLELGESHFRFRVVCSKGTYIRVLAEDIAIRLGTNAHLTKLVRTRVGSYCLNESEELESLTKRLREARQGD